MDLIDFRNFSHPLHFRGRSIYFYRDLTIKSVCVHIHVSDNREMMPEAENNRLPVDVDNREKFCDDESGLHAFKRER